MRIEWKAAAQTFLHHQTKLKVLCYAVPPGVEKQGMKRLWLACFILKYRFVVSVAHNTRKSHAIRQGMKSPYSVTNH